MRTLLCDPPPADFEQLLARRRRLGLDRRDEVWQGVLHMNPAPRGRHGDVLLQLAELLGPPARRASLYPIADFNLGEPDDYRVPDGGLHHERRDLTYYPSAALVVEVLSTGDETPEKIPFYAAHHVDELLIADPAERTVDWLALDEPGEYRPIERSRLVDLGPVELAEQIDWP